MIISDLKVTRRDLPKVAGREAPSPMYSGEFRFDVQDFGDGRVSFRMVDVVTGSLACNGVWNEPENILDALERILKGKP